MKKLLMVITIVGLLGILFYAASEQRSRSLVSYHLYLMR